MASTTCTPLTDFSGTQLPTVWNHARGRSVFGDVVLLLFVLAQCFDGVFTYVGVTSFGLGVEANPLVAGLMSSFGHGPGLVAAKGLAITLGIGLHVRRVHAAVAVLAGFYLLAAVLPWMAILFS